MTGVSVRGQPSRWREHLSLGGAWSRGKAGRVKERGREQPGPAKAGRKWVPLESGCRQREQGASAGLLRGSARSAWHS